MRSSCTSPSHVNSAALSLLRGEDRRAAATRSHRCSTTAEEPDAVAQRRRKALQQPQREHSTSNDAALLAILATTHALARRRARYGTAQSYKNLTMNMNHEKGRYDLLKAFYFDLLGFAVDPRKMENLDKGKKTSPTPASRSCTCPRNWRAPLTGADAGLR